LDVAQKVQHLPSKIKALRAIPNTEKRKKRRNQAVFKEHEEVIKSARARERRKRGGPARSSKIMAYAFLGVYGQGCRNEGD
jgi:hypothetical protein